MTIAAEHKGSRYGDTEVKQQVSRIAPVRPGSLVKHLDVGLRQAPAPAFGSHVSAELTKRILALPHTACCAILGMALPRLGWPRDHDLIAAVRRRI